MAVSFRAQARLLNQDELELVEKTRGEALKGAEDRDLNSLRAVIRERRDRARSIASRQRREMRGKAEPRGERPAGGKRRDNGQVRPSHLGAETPRQRNPEAETDDREPCATCAVDA